MSFVAIVKQLAVATWRNLVGLPELIVIHDDPACDNLLLLAVYVQHTYFCSFSGLRRVDDLVYLRLGARRPRRPMFFCCSRPGHVSYALSRTTINNVQNWLATSMAALTDRP